MLSIIVPVRNESNNLRDILDYFTKNLTQTSYEVLIINDYSDDKTLEQAKEIFSNNKNFKILDNKKKA